MKIRFTIPGAPRTAKNSPQLFGTSRDGRPVTGMTPSAAYKAWFKEAMTHAPIIKTQLRDAGVGLPIPYPVSVQAIFYRENAIVGDVVGYYQALGDWLQEPKWKPKRNGAGIIVDDSQIDNWDGSRRAIDRTSPRIEVCITILGRGSRKAV